MLLIEKAKLHKKGWHSAEPNLTLTLGLPIISIIMSYTVSIKAWVQTH